MNILSCKNLTMTYEKLLAVDNVSFDISDGDYVCIVGENGSGKSTLVKGLLGLKKPQSGSVVLGSSMKRTHIGYLPQQTQIQRDFPASVFEVVLSGCLNGCGLVPFYSKAQKSRAMENIKMLELDGLIKKSYKELSGGQQQRVLLARALCATEKLLVLDEPTAGLDPVVSAEFYSLIKRLNSEKKVTVIMVSHDIASAVTYAKKIIHMSSTVLFYGNTADYLMSDISKRLTGGVGHV